LKLHTCKTPNVFEIIELV